jgi:putative oxidoreductase
MTLREQLFSTSAPRAVILIRIAVGAVFLSEGIQKFLFPATLGVGRFVKIGIPFPEIAAPFVGLIEVGCGLLILIGFLTRVAAVPLILNMLVAISTTKIPIFMEKGLWAAAHEARVDVSMLLATMFLLAVGAGSWSLDASFRIKPGDRHA